jgi:ketosteroid isomerase-like protein
MPHRVAYLVLVSVVISAPSFGAERTPEGRAVDAVLTAFHTAAADADGEHYFSLLADDAVYIGTDATERWTIDEFKAFAEPYFAKGRGWTYTATERNIDIAPGGTVAWFDEILWNESYGTCRGTGVLLLVEGDWRIAQYHLTFPIPNDLSREITARIKEHTGHAQE